MIFSSFLSDRFSDQFQRLAVAQKSFFKKFKMQTSNFGSFSDHGDETKKLLRLIVLGEGERLSKERERECSTALSPPPARDSIQYRVVCYRSTIAAILKEFENYRKEKKTVPSLPISEGISSQQCLRQSVRMISLPYRDSICIIEMGRASL
jgi:hypothetical protein